MPTTTWGDPYPTTDEQPTVASDLRGALESIGPDKVLHATNSADLQTKWGSPDDAPIGTIVTATTAGQFTRWQRIDDKGTSSDWHEEVSTGDESSGIQNTGGAWEADLSQSYLTRDGRTVSFVLVTNYRGSTSIDGGASGNIPNQSLATIPVWFTPIVRARNVVVRIASVGGFGYISTAGEIVITAISPNNKINPDDGAIVSGTYVI